MKFIACETEYAAANIVLFGAPYDKTASNRKGARLAPAAMRLESQQIETYSPYVDRDLEDLRICDVGDLDLVEAEPFDVVDIISKWVNIMLSDEKLPIMLGGEHLVTLGAVQAAFEKFPDLCVIHLDAHTDLRDEYPDGEKLSHATVIKRCHDFLGNGRIFQFGIRSGTREEFEWAKSHTHLQRFDFAGFDKVVTKLGGKPIYFTLDIDVLDPSELCGTGTPEAGGVSFTALRELIEKLGKLNIVAADIVELAPQLDASGASTSLACKVLRELLLSVGG